VEVCICKETVLQNITATDELLSVANGLQHWRLLSLPLPGIHDAICVYTQSACREHAGETNDHVLTSMQLNMRTMDVALDTFYKKNALLPVPHCYSRCCNSCNFQNSQVS